MEKATQNVEIPAELRPVVLAAAKNLAAHLWGTRGPEWGTSFASLEDLARQIADSLGSQLLHLARERQANRPPPDPLSVCPSCSGPLDEQEPEPRSLRTTLGFVDWKEPSHCRARCRRAFFLTVTE